MFFPADDDDDDSDEDDEAGEGNGQEKVSSYLDFCVLCTCSNPVPLSFLGGGSGEFTVGMGDAGGC